MRNRKGMTLVEVIVAMALFAIVMVTVFTAFIITNVMNNVSKEFSDASYLAQNEMEIIYDLSRTSTVNEVKISRGYDCSASPCTYPHPDGNFVFKVSFTPHATLSGITIIVIEVEATTGDYAGDRAKIENYARFKVGD